MDSQQLLMVTIAAALVEIGYGIQVLYLQIFLNHHAEKVFLNLGKIIRKGTS